MDHWGAHCNPITLQIVFHLRMTPNTTEFSVWYLGDEASVFVSRRLRGVRGLGTAVALTDTAESGFDLETRSPKYKITY